MVYEPEMLWHTRHHGCNICLERLRKPRKNLKVDISTKGPHAGEAVYVFEMYITERDCSGMAAWLGAIKEGAQEGEKKISLTGIEVGRSSCCLLGLRN
jgi:hypothetical protein